MNFFGYGDSKKNEMEGEQKNRPLNPYKTDPPMKEPPLMPQPTKQAPPKVEHSDIAAMEDMQMPERKASLSLYDTVSQTERRGSDFDRLYRLSNLMHACASKDD